MNTLMRKTLVAALLAAFAGVWVVSAASSRPRLVVVLVVDQMRPDHLTRFDGLYTGGLRRLLDEGAVYLNGYHEHAYTVTGAGHASIATGSHPHRHGIVGNGWYDRAHDNEEAYSGGDDASLVGEPDAAGASPSQLLCDGLADWLKNQSPGSKVYALSLKDRSAVTMGGRRPDGAYWYDRRNGRFCTSTYYTDAYPGWVQAFNASGMSDSFYERGWRCCMPDSVYALSRADSFEAEADGEHVTFPYTFKDRFAPRAPDYYSWLRFSPFGDQLLIALAKELIAQEDLGGDDTPDLLFIGCSAADGVGHVWGPFSVEAQDYYLRLDGYLKDLFDLLDTRVGAGNYAVALSSDHGVLPLPEELVRQGIDARRVMWNNVQEAYASIGMDVAAQLAVSGDLIASLEEGILLDYTDTDSLGIERSLVRDMFAARVRELPWVADVFTWDELATGSARTRPFYDSYERGFHPDRGPDLYIRVVENTLVTSRLQGTSHGSPYEYDTRVPVVFAGSGFRPGDMGERVSTVDIAPTLARVLAIETGEADGRVIQSALAR